MGQRGPLANPERRQRIGTARKSTLPVIQLDPDVPNLPARPPATLGKTGKAVWTALVGLEWTQPSDRAGIMRLAQLEDERTLLSAALSEHGAMLKRPVMTARGDVVGEELYANPALRELRRLDAQILELVKGFGLTPMARARLGIAVVAAKQGMSTLEKLTAARMRR